MKARPAAALAFVCFFPLAATVLADDHGGTFATATRIPADNSGKFEFAGNLDTDGDIDMFRFTVPSTTMIWLYTSGGTDTFLSLYDASGARMDYDNNDGPGYNARLFRNGAQRLLAGDYYVAVTAGGSSSQPQTGNYTLGVRTQANALPFTMNDQPGNLEQAGTVDLYRFDLTAETMAWIYTTGIIDTYIELFDANGTKIDYDQDGGDGYNARVFRNGADNMKPGRYYVAVSGGGNLTQPQTGDYALSLRDRMNALAIQRPDTISRIKLPGEVDLFRLRVNRETMAWVYTTGSTDTRIDLYDQAGARIDYDTSSGAGYNALIFRTGADRLVPGDYYIAVSGGGVSGQPQTGDYSLGVRTQGKAQAFNEADITRRLLVEGDIHLYRLDVQRPGMAFFHTIGNKDTSLQLLDANGTSMEINNNSGAGYNASVSANLAVGAYYLKVQGGGTSSQAQTGSYTLSKRMPGNAEPVFHGGTIRRSISAYGEIDQYVFPAKAGAVDFGTTGTTNTYGSLWGSDGQLIGSNDSSGEDGINFRITSDVAAGNCYLTVRGSSIDLHKGAYALVSVFPSRTAVFPATDAWLAGSLRHVFQIGVKADKPWSVSESLPWLNVAATGTNGDGQVAVTVFTNQGGERSGLIHIGGVPVRITQQGKETRSPGDWNGDGGADLVLQNTATGRTAAWFMNGGSIHGTSMFPVLPGDAGRMLVNHGDFNGDGIPDQVWQDPANGDIDIHYCSGMNITDQGPLDTRPGAANRRVVAVGDFSKSGNREIVLQDFTSGKLVIWRVDPARHVSWTGQFSIDPVGSQWHVAGAGDINGDGACDLLLQNIDNGQINAWTLDGTKVVSTGALGHQPGSKNWKVCAMEDFDGDGRADVMMQDETTGKLMLWFLKGRTVTGGGEVPQKWPDASWEVRNSRTW